MCILYSCSTTVIWNMSPRFSRSQHKSMIMPSWCFITFFRKGYCRDVKYMWSEDVDKQWWLWKWLLFERAKTKSNLSHPLIKQSCLQHTHWEVIFLSGFFFVICIPQCPPWQMTCLKLSTALGQLSVWRHNMSRHVRICGEQITLDAWFS